jgi:hypothetical protein
MEVSAVSRYPLAPELGLTFDPKGRILGSNGYPRE